MTGVRPAACPKCGAAVPADTAACRRCGLGVGHMAGFGATDDAAVGPLVHAAWARARATWDEPAAHDAFLQTIAAAGAFAWAARQYRAEAVGRVGDTVALTMQARLVRMTDVGVLSSAATRRTPPPRMPYRGVLVLLLIGIVVLCGGAIMASRRSTPRTPGAGTGTMRPLTPAAPVLR